MESVLSGTPDISGLTLYNQLKLCSNLIKLLPRDFLPLNYVILFMMYLQNFNYVEQCLPKKKASNTISTPEVITLVSIIILAFYTNCAIDILIAMATSSGNLDWQIGLKCVKDRASKVLDSGQWSDCVFIVGTEGRQEAHKLILAMASPVFEAMFYGSLADKDEKPIEILDVQPQAFRALLKYLYTDEINFLSFDQVCEICYAAKKYMIPPLVEECTKYIWKDLHPGNVCRAFAFVRLFEEPRLLEQCMQMIKTLTEDVVRDQSFEEVDTNTLKAILSQETLNVFNLQSNAVCQWPCSFQYSHPRGMFQPSNEHFISRGGPNAHEFLNE
ncbi:BTB/POZ domain-containing protein 6-A [Armadillidium vulgare]|nr:BTB/POZ domain-containing protein 6-A [Armadillidium vulgare]